MKKSEVQVRIFSRSQNIFQFHHPAKRLIWSTFSKSWPISVSGGKPRVSFLQRHTFHVNQIQYDLRVQKKNIYRILRFFKVKGRSMKSRFTETPKVEGKNLRKNLRQWPSTFGARLQASHRTQQAHASRTRGGSQAWPLKKANIWNLLSKLQKCSRIIIQHLIQRKEALFETTQLFCWHPLCGKQVSQQSSCPSFHMRYHATPDPSGSRRLAQLKEGVCPRAFCPVGY